ncbi:uncharacterized protein LOC144349224 [Saccoglossus kowalevskii]
MKQWRKILMLMVMVWGVTQIVADRHNRKHYDYTDNDIWKSTGRNNGMLGRVIAGMPVYKNDNAVEDEQKNELGSLLLKSFVKLGLIKDMDDLTLPNFKITLPGKYATNISSTSMSC